MKDAIVNFVESKRAKANTPIRVGFVGFGKTNAAIYAALNGRCRCDFTLRQEGDNPICAPDGIRVIRGDAALCDIYEDILFLSPSVRRERISYSCTAILSSDTDIFFSKKRNTFAVTGSDGKSTVTTLSSLLLSESFPDAFIGGNIGTPVALARLQSTSAFVLELSSFNLSYVIPYSHRAIVTNLSPNHLNWHASFEEYSESKRRALIFTDEPIINADTEAAEKTAEGIPLFAVCSTLHDSDTLVKRYRPEHVLTLEGERIMLDGESVLRVSELRRRERHNVANMMSAIAMSIGYADRELVCRVAGEFCGLEHRCEHFHERDGITFINSSIDTSPERTRATLSSLGKRVTLILGGRGKGLELTPLISPLADYAERIAIYGEIKDELADFIKSHKELSAIPRESFIRFDEALEYATRYLTSGDTLLLSPSATAYGEFVSFEERGAHFKKYILQKYNKTKN